MDNFITPSDSLGETNTRPVILSAKDEISKMCLSVLDDVEAGKIKSLPVNERTLRRAANGESVDDKTVRTIACLYYKTEDFSKLFEVVPMVLKTTIENANNKLSHQGVVPFEVARNSELVKLWNLCLGYGCSATLGKKYFGEDFLTMINTLVEYKIVTKSVLVSDLWIASGEMIINREDGLYHYDQMHEVSRPIFENPKASKVVQYCGEMTRDSYNQLQEKIVELYHEFVKEKSLIESESKEVKFNFQVSLCELDFESER